MSTKKEQYYEGIGRRKKSISRVRITKVSKGAIILVNDREVGEFFNTEELAMSVLAPLEAVSMTKEFQVSIKVNGGGQRGQAEASQLGLSRALIKYDGELQKTLRDLDYLKRDPRQKERKKPGLKKARRAPQWSKR
jgi:small subunit ribosomal protein S9